MRTKLTLLVAILVSFGARAADAPNSTLQKGLFEEEANQNLDAAIGAYQSVLAAHDNERKLAATALFRLGECYRKLGKTNDAASQYRRLVTEFPDQATLVNLSSQNLIGLGIRVTPQNSDEGTRTTDQVRLQERAIAAQLAEAEQLNSTVKQLGNLSRSELRRVMPTLVSDALLNKFLEQLAHEEQALSGLLSTRTAEHPEVKGVREKIAVLNAQIEERIDGILQGLKVKEAALANEAQVLRRALAGQLATPRATGAMQTTRSEDPVARAQLKELLQNEVQIAEQFATEQRKKVAIGTLAPGDQVRFERDVLGLKRQLVAVDGLAAAKDREEWRKLLEQEIKLAEEAVKLEKQKLDGGKSLASEVARLQRDVLILKRELVTFDATPEVSTASSAVRPATTTAPTDEEEKEIRRIQALTKDSPDLINTPVAPNHRTPLESAATAGQLTVAGFLLAHGAEVNKSGSGYGPLNLAARNGHRSMVELLLANGAAIDASGPDGKRPLMLAAENGFKGVVEVLLANKADPNLPDGPNYLTTPRQDLKRTPLHAAAEKGNAAIARLLLAKGAKVDAQTSGGETPLDFAADGGHNDMVKLLLDNKANVNARTSYGWTPLHEAAQRGHESTARLLLDNGAEVDATNKSDRTPLAIAAMAGSPAAVPLLLARKADPNRRDTDGLTPLALAVTKDDPELIAALLAGGADPNSTKPGNWTPLFSVVQRGRADLAEMLLKAKANPNAEVLRNTGTSIAGKEVGMTPLMKAITKNELQMVRLLLKYKADPNLRNDSGNTPLQLAINFTSAGSASIAALVEELLNAGADPNALDSGGDTALTAAVLRRDDLIELLLNHQANPNARNRDGFAPIHIAAGKGYNRVMELLLTAKADPNATDTAGRTALDYIRNNIRIDSGGPVLQPVPTAPGPQLTSRQSEMLEILRKGGANEWAPRHGQITLTRRSNGALQAVFQKGTNDLNQFTLYEVLAAKGWSGRPGGWVFPDFARVTVSRLNAKTGQVEEIPLNVAASVESGNCTNNVPLRWGDLVNVPESEHELNAQWGGLSPEFAKALAKCLERTIRLTVKGQTGETLLKAEVTEASNNVAGKWTSVAFILPDFSLKSVLQKSGKLLSSSDLTRVKVKRRDTPNGQPREWIFNLEKVAAPNDLWLREGDVIEVPEK